MAYKINAFNYVHVRNSIARHGIPVTAKAYGLSSRTLADVKRFATYEQYKANIENQSRQQYQRRINRQKRRLFSGNSEVQNKMHFDGNITLNKVEEPKEEPVKVEEPVKTEAPFETRPDLGIAKTIVTNVTKPKLEEIDEKPINFVRRLPNGQQVLVEQPIKPRRERTVPPLMTQEKFNIAVDMASRGELKGDIASAIGYKSSAVMTYQIAKNPAWAASFKRALENGQEAYKHNLGRRIGKQGQKLAQMRDSSNILRAAIKEERPTPAPSSEVVSRTKELVTRNEAGKSNWQKSLETGAAKMGMTVEEYKKWRMDKLHKAASKSNSERASKKKEEEKQKEKQNNAEDVKNNKNENAERPALAEAEEKTNTVGESVPALSDAVREAIDKVTRNVESLPHNSPAGFTTCETTISAPNAEEMVRYEKELSNCDVPPVLKDAKGVAPQAVADPGVVALARGKATMYASIGKAIKILAWGILALLLGFSASLVIDAYTKNQNNSKVDWGNCTYELTSWGYNTVKCDTIK